MSRLFSSTRLILGCLVVFFRWRAGSGDDADDQHCGQQYDFYREQHLGGQQTGLLSFQPVRQSSRRGYHGESCHQNGGKVGTHAKASGDAPGNPVYGELSTADLSRYVRVGGDDDGCPGHCGRYREDAET